MSTASVSRSLNERTIHSSARVADYMQLAKPRIAAMGVVAVAVGYSVGSQGTIVPGELVSACLGIASVAIACSFLNQWFEGETDAKMARTADRPVPGGRVSSFEVLFVGGALTFLGLVWLWTQVNALTCALSLLTLVLYVAVYTPLKRVSSLCTVIGAVAGAMPPVLGWTASGQGLDGGALALFLVLFAWQFPHFLAIATIYRDDYEAAGLRMLPLVREDRNGSGLVAVCYAIVLIPVSMMVWQVGLAGNLYVAVAVTGGFAYLVASIRFLADQSMQRARELVLCSIVYLPVVLLTMTWDHFRLLS
jgi:protoheme IX farnesyltransferase